MNSRMFVAFVILVSLVFAAPQNLDISINDGDDYTDSVSVTLTISADNPANLSCRFSNDDSSYTSWESFVASKSWDLESGDGSKTVWVECNDSSDNQTDKASDGITLDTEAPDFSDLTPSDGSTTSDATPDIEVDIDDSTSGVNESSIQLVVDGDDETSNSDFTGGTLSYTPSSDLDVGLHTVEVTASDNAGNPDSTSWEFNVSSQGVEITSVDPAEDEYTTDDEPTIRVEVDDHGYGIDYDRSYMLIDGSNVSNESGYSFSSDEMRYNPPDEMDEGIYNIDVYIYDSFGEETHKEWSFTIDYTEPVIDLFVPEDGSTVAGVTLISASFEDDVSGIDEGTFKAWLDSISITGGSDIDYDDGEFEFEPDSYMSAGTYIVEAEVRDNAGNKERVSWSFTIASTAPIISDKSPDPDSTITSTQPEISCVITDSGTSGIKSSSIRIYFDSSDVTAGAVYSPSSGELTYIPPFALDDGEHTVRVVASDNRNNEADVDWDFTVDTTAPNSPGSFTAGPDQDGVLLTWSLSTSDDVEKYVIYGSRYPFYSIDGMDSLALADDDETEYTDAGVEEHYYYALVAEDEAGHQSEPVFAGSCSGYSDGSWDDYECCWDSDCESGQTCDNATNKCTGGQPEAGDEQEASREIDDAEDEIGDALAAGKNVTEAENLLSQAKSAYNAGNYEQAKQLAGLAISAARDAPEGDAEELPEEGRLPCCPAAILLLVPLAYLSRIR